MSLRSSDLYRGSTIPLIQGYDDHVQQMIDPVPFLV